MIEKALDQIEAVDLHALVAQQRPEGRRLDYKLALPGGGAESTKEFLADVTSFSNTDGGDLVIGIQDEDGTAAAVVGIPSDGLDNEITRIENMVRDGVEPRLPGFHIHTVPLENGTVALILRMSASLVAPHRVKASSRFHARNSRGKYPLDVGELRMAFAATDEMPRKMRDLHSKAILAVGGKDMPTRVGGGPKVVLTVAPLSVLRDARDLNIDQQNAVLPARSTQAINFVVGLEGLIVHSTGPEPNAVRTWSVNHRRGFVDFAWQITGTTIDNVEYIPRALVETQLRGAARSAYARLLQHGIEGPWTAMATLLEIEGFRVGYSLPDGFNAMTDPSWMQEAYLGEVICDAIDDAAVQPLIDAFWRVFGAAQPPVGPQ
ncbi:helix-turn-helix domain-containing protein [Sphingopyxis sp. DBS4]|uniref:AlbA family DNA-binding domain-containing protein n=1 Tax=Sphingopyxis sp. DBS4 TaxID=2968500 RepID=UPI00214C599D|nr:ATP-binding protein [Sphingopyxis sp. DBS4]